MLAGPTYWFVSRLALFVAGAVPRRWRSLPAAHVLALVALALPLGWLGVALDGWPRVGTLTILPAAGWWYARGRRAVAAPAPWRLPWYRLTVRVPRWFTLAALAEWGVVAWRGVAPVGRSTPTGGTPSIASAPPTGTYNLENPFR